MFSSLYTVQRLAVQEGTSVYMDDAILRTFKSSPVQPLRSIATILQCVYIFYFFGSCFIIGNSLAKSFTSLECPIFLFSFALFVLNLAAKFPFPLCWKPEPVIPSWWQYNVDHCLPHFYA
jgi:hypothetical protein